jgi:hypothetical protein
MRLASKIKVEMSVISESAVRAWSRCSIRAEASPLSAMTEGIFLVQVVDPRQRRVGLGHQIADLAVGLAAQ